MNKKYYIAAVAIMILSIFVGCGRKNKDSDSNTDLVSETTTAYEYTEVSEKEDKEEETSASEAEDAHDKEDASVSETDSAYCEEDVEEAGSVAETTQVSDKQEQSTNATGTNTESTEFVMPTEAEMPATPTTPTTLTEPSGTTHTHNYTDTIVKLPTCVIGGYTTYICSCGDWYRDDYTDPVAENHKWELTSRWAEEAITTQLVYHEYICYCDAAYDTYEELAAHQDDSKSRADCLDCGNKGFYYGNYIEYNPEDPHLWRNYCPACGGHNLDYPGTICMGYGNGGVREEVPTVIEYTHCVCVGCGAEKDDTSYWYDNNTGNYVPYPYEITK